jgi:hypothetical protein
MNLTMDVVHLTGEAYQINHLLLMMNLTMDVVVHLTGEAHQINHLLLILFYLRNVFIF